MYATRYRPHALRAARVRPDRRRRSPAVPARDRVVLLLLAAAAIFILGIQLGIHHGASLYGCK